MRNDHTCPKCEGKRFYVVDEVRMRDSDSFNGTDPLALAASYLEYGPAGRFTGKKEKKRFEANIEAWICRSCSYAELYANDLGALDEMVALGDESIREVDGSKPTSEYR